MSALQLVKSEFHGSEISFTGQGWFNATQAAARFGKRPVDWLNLASTKEYIAALIEDARSEENSLRKQSMGRSSFIKTSKGGDVSRQGTWLHPLLGVRFAQWLDVRFAIWCDKQIDAILRGNLDQKKARHEAASSFKVMQSALQLIREEQGKMTESHHFSNEARLINYAVAGKYKSLDRNTLSADELDLLAKLEVKNSVLLGRGVDYDSRKTILKQYAIDIRGTGQRKLAV